MESEQEYFIWRLFRYNGWTNELINWGVREESIEMFVEDVIPECVNSSIDRDMSDMQDCIDEYFPDKNYIFQYQNFNVKFGESKWKVK